MKKRSVIVNTHYGSHLVVLEQDERRGYVAIVSALPGVITWGATIAQAKEMAREAIELCIESLVAGKSEVKADKRLEKYRRMRMPAVI